MIVFLSLCGGTADAPGLEPGAPDGACGCKSHQWQLNNAVVAELADAPGSEPGALHEVACGCKSHQRQICDLCTGFVSSLPAARATHDKKCRKARPYQRQFFAEHGYWPGNKSNNLLVQFQDKSRSFKRAIAALKTKS